MAPEHIPARIEYFEGASLRPCSGGCLRHVAKTISQEDRLLLKQEPSLVGGQSDDEAMPGGIRVGIHLAVRPFLLEFLVN